MQGDEQGGACGARCLDRTVRVVCPCACPLQAAGGRAEGPEGALGRWGCWCCAPGGGPGRGLRVVCTAGGRLWACGRWALGIFRTGACIACCLAVCFLLGSPNADLCLDRTPGRRRAAHCSTELPGCLWLLGTSWLNYVGHAQPSSKPFSHSGLHPGRRTRRCC